jgi:hypothetical protein
MKFRDYLPFLLLFLKKYSISENFVEKGAPGNLSGYKVESRFAAADFFEIL